MAQIFKSSPTRGGSFITPEKIVITAAFFQWSFNRGINSLYIGRDTVTVPRKKITSVELIDKFIGTDILIWLESGQFICCKNFKSTDAKIINEIILKNLI
jgi:hypothetical protein